MARVPEAGALRAAAQLHAAAPRNPHAMLTQWKAGETGLDSETRLGDFRSMRIAVNTLFFANHCVEYFHSLPSIEEGDVARHAELDHARQPAQRHPRLRPDAAREPAEDVTESVKALADAFQVRRYGKAALHVLAVQI